jgi:hypothetical protein
MNRLKTMSQRVWINNNNNEKSYFHANAFFMSTKLFVYFKMRMLQRFRSLSRKQWKFRQIWRTNAKSKDYKEKYFWKTFVLRRWNLTFTSRYEYYKDFNHVVDEIENFVKSEVHSHMNLMRNGFFKLIGKVTIFSNESNDIQRNKLDRMNTTCSNEFNEKTFSKESNENEFFKQIK